MGKFVGIPKISQLCLKAKINGALDYFRRKAL
jgi:hypothetical protein